MNAPLRLGVLASHPIQYQAPLFRELAGRVDLEVCFAHRQRPSDQARAGYGVEFDWDVALLDGYRHVFLDNRARRPGVDSFWGCDTPGVAERIPGRDAFLVMGWHLRCYLQAVRACRRAGVAVMVRGDSTLGRPRSPAVHALKRVLYPHLLARFDACLAVGSAARAYLRHYGVAPGRIVCSPHCVDNALFAAGTSRGTGEAERLRQTWGAGPGDTVALFVGRLVDYKRPIDLVDAAARLALEGATVVPVFAGDGPARAGIEQAAMRSSVPATLLGFQNQGALPAIYGAADMLVLPSSAVETWGLVVNEAMASGTPAVVSDQVGCAPDLIRPGETGELFAYGDPGSLARAIARLRAALASRDLAPAIAVRAASHSVERAADGIVEAAGRFARAAS